jgi:hypothetical protein
VAALDSVAVEVGAEAEVWTSCVDCCDVWKVSVGPAASHVVEAAAEKMEVLVEAAADDGT